MVSIIVPVYNVDKFLHNCIDSILKQSFADIEIILVDDGSDDNSGIICDQFASSDSRVKVIHKKNEGVAIARLVGVQKSRGEYLSFVDADDHISPNYIFTLLSESAKDDCDIVVCQAYIDRGNSLGRDIHSALGLYKKEELEKLLKTTYLYDPKVKTSGMPLYLWGKLFKRDLIIKSIKEGVGIWHGEDQVVVFKAMLGASVVKVIPNYLYFYVMHQNQAIRKIDDSYWDTQIACWRKYKQLDDNKFLSSQFPLRIWQVINQYIKRILLPTCSGHKEFGNTLSSIKKLEFVSDLFKDNYYLNDGLKSNVRFWLMKLNLNKVLYYLMIRKRK